MFCAELTSVGRAEKTEKGTILFRQGEPVRGLYVVTSGSVRLSLVEQGAVSDRHAGPSSVLGLPATMTGNAYSLTAQVLEPSQVFFVERDKVLGLLREQPHFCFEVVEILAHEVGHMRRDTAAALASVN
jgi:CRP-like cAMP-binding protein